MNENLKAIKRLVAFFLCIFMLGSMVGNDVFVIATEENQCEEFEDEHTYAANVLQPVESGDGYCDNCGHVEESHNPQEEAPEEAQPEVADPAAGAAEGGAPAEDSNNNGNTDGATAEQVPASDGTNTENPTQPAETPASNEVQQDDVYKPIISPTEEIPVENKEEVTDEEQKEKEELDKKKEEEKELTDEEKELLEKEQKEKELEEQKLEEQKLKELEEQKLKELEEKCEHEEWDYTSNGDGTHVKKCKNCDEQTTEDCTFDPEGKCIHCEYVKPEEGYELVYTTFSKTIDDAVVTVEGDLPEGATIDISAVDTDYAEQFLAETGNGEYKIFRAFDIKILVDGNEYQPNYDDNKVRITVSGISELKDVPDSNVEVLRVEHDENNTNTGEVSELASDVNGDEVTFESEHFSFIFIGTSEETSAYEMKAIDPSQVVSIVKVADGSKYHQVSSVEFYVYLEGTGFSCNASVRKGLSSAGQPMTGTVVAEASQSIAASVVDTHGDGWYRVKIDFSTDDSTWISPGEYYSINVYGFNDTANIAYDVSGAASNTVYLTTLGTTNSTAIDESAMFIVTESTPVDAPDDIDYMTIASKTLNRSIYTASEAGAKIYEGEIYYIKGEEDKLAATLSPNISRALEWTLSSSSVVSLSSGSGSENTITANTAGKVTLTVKYSETVKVVLDIVVLAPFVNDAENYSVAYSGSEQKPTVKFNDGTSTSTSGIGELYYADNTNAGTAKITVPYTTGHSVTYNFEVPFTITKKALSWDSNFKSATFNINIDTDTVTSVDGATSGIDGVNLTLGTDYTVTLSNKSYPSGGGISYTVTIGEGPSGNYSGTSGTYTVATSSMDINNFAEVRWASGAKSSYEYTGSEIKDLSWGSFVFYLKGTTKPATFITQDKTTVTYVDNTNVGTGHIRFAVQGYNSYLDLPMEIYAYTMNGVDFSVTITNEDKSEVTSGYATYTHTGAPITPDTFEGEDHITVKYGETTLTKGTDYTVSYTGNVNIGVGTAVAIITGKGNFTGELLANFTIEASYANDAEIRVNSSTNYKANKANQWTSGYSEDFTGAAIKPSVLVFLGGKKLNQQDDKNSTTDGYYLEYADSINDNGSLKDAITINAGTKYVVCSGTGKYKGTYIYATYTVKKINISNNSGIELTINKDSFVFTGNEITLGTSDYSLTYTYGTIVNTLLKDTHYTIAYQNNTNVGTATFTITAKDDSNYTGTINGSFSITQATINDSMLTLNYDKDSYDKYYTVYTGTERKPIVTVTYNTIKMGETDSETANFTVKVTNNISVTDDSNLAVVTVTGRGNLKGEAVVNFKITAKSIESVKVKLEGYEVSKDSYGNYYCAGYKPTYTGKPNKPIPELKDGTTTLVQGTHYTVSYLLNTAVSNYASKAAAGKAADTTEGASRAIITGIGNYAGTTITVYFDIEPRDITASSVDKTGIAAHVAWSAILPEAGYFVPAITIVDNGTDLKSTLRGQTLSTECYDAVGDTTATVAGPVDGTGYILTITGKGNYKGTFTHKYFVGYDIKDAAVNLKSPYTGVSYGTASDGTFLVNYMGENQPNQEIKYGDAELKPQQEGSDDYQYTETRTSITGYGDDIYNSYAGKNIVKVTMTGTNGYYGKCEYSYKINPIDLSTADQANSQIKTTETEINKGYTGSNIDVTKTFGFKYTITKTNAGIATEDFVETKNYDDGYNTEYTITPTYVGPEIGLDQSVTVSAVTTGKGNYKNGFNFKYNVTTGSLGNITITASDASGVYWNDTDKYYWVYYKSGQAITFDNLVTVRNKAGDVLTKGTDYTLTYTNNDVVSKPDASPAILGTITATGMGKYGGTTPTPATFRVVAIDVKDEFIVTLTNNDFTYDGHKKEPEVIVTNKSGTVLTKNTHYTVSYPSETGKNTLPGRADDHNNYVTVTGMGIYTGSVDTYFDIMLDLSNTTYTKVEPTKTSYIVGDNLTTADVTVSYSPDGGTSWTTYNAKTGGEDNYSVTANTAIPGTGKITVTGLHTGTHNTGTGSKEINVQFKGKIQNYVHFSTYDFAYTGSDISIEDALTVDYGVKDTDYTITYKAGEDRKTVGPKHVTIAAKTGSTLYDETSTTGEVEYFIKYDLDTATFNVEGNDSTIPISYDATDKYWYTTYTGAAITHPEKYHIVGTFGAAQTTVISNTTPGSEYLKIEDTGLTSVGTKYITVSAKDSNYVMGTPKNLKFVIKGNDITNYYARIKKTDGSYDITGNYSYNGSEIKPDVLVKPTESSPDSKILEVGKQILVSYNQNVDVSTTQKKAYVTITGNSDYGYTGSIVIYYTIDPMEISGCKISTEEATYAGFGIPVRPKVTVKNGSIVLKEGEDYTVVYGNNTTGATENTGIKGTLEIKAVSGSNYTGSILPTDVRTDNDNKFDIVKLDMRNNSITLEDQKGNTITEASGWSVEYTGSPIDLYSCLTVKYANPYYNSDIEGDVEIVTLANYITEGSAQDYTITVLDTTGTAVDIDGKLYCVKDMGSYVVKVTGNNNCKETLTIPLTVSTRSLAENYHYYYTTESGFVPEDGWVASEDLNKDPDVAEPGYIAHGGLTGDSLTIYVYDVTSVTPGTNNVPKIAIIDSEVIDSKTSKPYELIEGTDFTLSVTNATEVGTAAWSRVPTADYHARVAATSPAVTITGMGNYVDSITLPFNIGKNLETLKPTVKFTNLENTDLVNSQEYTYVAADKDKVGWSYLAYNGVEQKPSEFEVSFTSGNVTKQLLPGRDFKVTYTDASGDEDASINAGEKYVILTGVGDYCGTISQKYAINKKLIQAKAVIKNKGSASGQINGDIFSTESVLKATSDGTETGTTQLTFDVSGWGLLDNTSASKYLYENGMISEEFCTNYAGWRYRIYDKNYEEPTVSVVDNTLAAGALSDVISEDDIEVKCRYNGSETPAVSTFTESSGVIKTWAELVVSFKSTSATDFTKKGNYYITGTSGEEAPTTFKIAYIVVKDTIGDNTLDVQFMDGLSGNKYPYTGSPIEPTLKVTYGGVTLTKEYDYRVTYAKDSYDLSGNIIPGTKTITVTGINNYSGSKTLNFYITGNLADTEPCYLINGNYVPVANSSYRQQYTGGTIDPDNLYLILPAKHVKAKDYPLAKNTHFSKTNYGSPDNYVTEAWLLYEGITAGESYWSGEKKVTYYIQFDASKVKFAFDEKEYEYTGYSILPEIKLKDLPDDSYTLDQSSIEYSNDEYFFNKSKDPDDIDTTNVGSVYVRGKYTLGTSITRTATSVYHIVKRPLSNSTVVCAETQRYTGSQVKPSFTVFIESNNLRTGDGQVYTLSLYDESTGTGDYSVTYGTKLYDEDKMTLTAKSTNLSGTRDVTYNIKLQAIANLHVTENTGNSLTVEWVKDMYSDGTQLELQKLDSNGNVISSQLVWKAGNTATFTGLSSSTTYNIVGTAYAKVSDEKTLYSDSKELKATTDISTTDIDVTSNAKGKATVTWTKDGNVTLYYIYVSETEEDEGRVVAIIPASTGKYTKSKLTSGKTYYFHVVGYTLVDGTPQPVNSSSVVPITIQ